MMDIAKLFISLQKRTCLYLRQHAECREVNNMRFTLVATLIFIVGCMGSATPHNPMKATPTAEPWWQASTASVSSNNPWEIYLEPREAGANDDPWKNYEHPRLFPEDFPCPKDGVDSSPSQPIIPSEELEEV